MQQTNKYKLNLIEPDDPFLPDGLNANTQKVEDVLRENLEGMQNALYAMGDAQTDFDRRLGTGGKTARIAWGSYSGNDKYGKSSPNKLTFDFCPVLVIVCQEDGAYSDTMSHMLRPSLNATGGGSRGPITLSWQEQGVSWYSAVHSSNQYNAGGNDYYYLAIGYDKNA